MTGIPDPSACGWCDHPERGHDEQFHLYASDRHGYMRPSQGLILHRMRQRQLARIAAKTPKPIPPECHITITAEDVLTPAVKGAIEQIDFYQWTNEMRGDRA